MLSALTIEDLVRAALKEDLGHGFDMTSEYLIAPDKEARLVLAAREDGVLSGMVVAMAAFLSLDPDCEPDIEKQDGEWFKAGDTLAAISGPARALLTAERVALNFIQHMSGIASETAKYVEAVSGTRAGILCTRKTAPGLRAVQKYAVRCGGGVNHRFGLDDGILIKDNHIALAGGIAPALDRAREQAGPMVKVEIEVDTLDQLKAVLDHGGAHIVLLDNFKISDLKQAVAEIDGSLIAEASGGIALDTVRSVAETGVDFISAGALTHSVKAIDIGLDFEG